MVSKSNPKFLKRISEKPFLFKARSKSRQALHLEKTSEMMKAEQIVQKSEPRANIRTGNASRIFS